MVDAPVAESGTVAVAGLAGGFERDRDVEIVSHAVVCYIVMFREKTVSQRESEAMISYEC